MLEAEPVIFKRQKCHVNIFSALLNVFLCEVDHFLRCLNFSVIYLCIHFTCYCHIPTLATWSHRFNSIWGFPHLHQSLSITDVSRVDFLTPILCWSGTQISTPACKASLGSRSLFLFFVLLLLWLVVFPSAPLPQALMRGGLHPPVVYFLTKTKSHSEHLVESTMPSDFIKSS